MKIQKTYKPRIKSPEQALQALMNLCAKSEKSTGDAKRLLFRWGIEPAVQEKIISKLVTDRFIDNQRYAEAFVREKITLSGWGNYKIRVALRTKQIEEEIINQALSQADGNTMQHRLEEQLRRKIKSTKASNAYDLRGKLLRYGTSRGFEYEMVCDTIDKLITETE